MIQRRFGPQCRRPSSERPGNVRGRKSSPRSSETQQEFGNQPFVRDPMIARLEAILFLATEPISLKKLSTLLGVKNTAEAKLLIQRLQALHDSEGTAFAVSELAGGFQLFTRPAFHPWIMRANRVGASSKLSSAMLETLAIVAQRQPIIRADIEGIRGVGSGEMLTQLMERGLIKIVGRHESLGRPSLFGTTKKFLQVFGLNRIEDFADLAEQQGR